MHPDPQTPDADTTRTGTPVPGTDLVTRHLRVDRATWRAANVRAARERAAGTDPRGIGAIVDALLSGYAAGELDAPPASSPRQGRPGSPDDDQGQSSTTTTHHQPTGAHQ